MKRFRVGQAVVCLGNSTRRGVYLGRFQGSCVVRWDKPIRTRQNDLISSGLVHESNLFPAKSPLK